LEHVTSVARQNAVGLALGTCFREDDDQCYNQLRFYTPQGTYLGFHSKILLCGGPNLSDPGEINHFATTALKVFKWNDSLTIGGLICNDMWANPQCTSMPDPHQSQQLASLGARVIFHAVNGGRSGDDWSQLIWQYHQSNLQMRARAGKLWVVTVDNSFPTDLPSSAPSGVIDPQGNWACRTEPAGEQFFTHTIELPD